MRIGAKVPNSGDLPSSIGIGEMAQRLEKAGFESLWCSDHVVMTRSIESRYPFSEDGTIAWDAKSPWWDSIVSLAVMATMTEAAEIGVAVMIVPLRHPIVLAKQIATVDALAKGRVALGVGSGWLAEEYAALQVPFDSRGARLEEWLDIMRDCWTGEPAERDGRYYSLPNGVICHPTPHREPPVLIGGMSPAAIRRAARMANGWLALQPVDRLDPELLQESIRLLRSQAEERNRDPFDLRVTLRITESGGAVERVARAMPALERIGVNEVIVDCSWIAEGDAEEVYERLRYTVDTRSY